MNSKLMREFEELEGLSDKILDELPIQIEDTGDEDLDFKPANATAISSADVYYEV